MQCGKDNRSPARSCRGSGEPTPGRGRHMSARISRRPDRIPACMRSARWRTRADLQAGPQGVRDARARRGSRPRAPRCSGAADDACVPGRGPARSTRRRRADSARAGRLRPREARRPDDERLARRPPPRPRVSHRRRQIRARSPPAVRKRVAATPTPHLASPHAISRSSLSTRPPKPRRFRRSSPPTTRAESEAGHSASRRRIPHVAHHDRRAPAASARRNGSSSVRLELGDRDADLRRAQVGVDGRPPVTRKVLGDRDQPSARAA